MSRTFTKVIWTTFAEPDNRYLDLFRVGYALGLLTFLGLAIAAAVRGEPWGPVEFGTGFGALLFGGGVGVGMRAKFEDGTAQHIPEEGMP
jgi:hypothetical protein